MKCAGKVTRTNGCQELWYIRHLSALIAKHAGHERPREVRSKVYDLDTMHCATVERAELVHDDVMTGVRGVPLERGGALRAIVLE